MRHKGSAEDGGDGRSREQRVTFSGLTRRQRQIVDAVLDGATNREIAGQLNLSEQTVKNQLSAVYARVGVSGRMRLANLCRRELRSDFGARDG